jgi:isocitrate dehydrogenase (NAD+)
MLMSAIEMLNYINEREVGVKIRKALFKTFEDNIKTADLGGNASCSEFTDEIIKRL